jgi:3-isopropylmalate/(R)-2-methylmalate dehydratase large subunit
MEKKTLFDKIWDAHVVKSVEKGPDVLFIDKHFIHEVTSPVAFLNLQNRGNTVLFPERTIATPDHNVPTEGQEQTIKDKLSRMQVEKLRDNCKKYGIELHDLGTEHHGIVHVIGPELGITQPGMTIVCGDSHTSTHGAFGAIAFGIGTSEVEMVFASQCIMQSKPKKMRITIDGEVGPGVSSKDIILYVISKISASGGTGYFLEYAGSAITSLSMEARMTICNMSIEMGARGGLIAPDEKTYEYLKGKKYAPKGAEWGATVEHWKSLKTDEGAEFDLEYHYDAADIEPMITYGTNPGMGIKIKESIPTGEELVGSNKKSYQQALDYMGFSAGEPIKGKKVDYVFVGSCTNGRIEDIRAVAHFVKGKQKAENITAWIVPGSKEVERLAHQEGLVEILEAAGFELRQPGCSACLAMNEDKIPSGKYAVSTSNRNFEGRQGPGARTLLASPLTVAAVAVTGVITDPREFLSLPVSEEVVGH